MRTFSFFDYLERLRQKPEPERRRIVVLVAAVLTLLILLLWLLNFQFLTSLQTPTRAGPAAKSLGLAARLQTGVILTWQRVQTGWQRLWWRPFY